jgi:hypothetical protein
LRWMQRPSGRDFLQECLEGNGAFGNGGADLVRIERGGGGVEADVDVGVAFGVRAAVSQNGAISRRRNRDRHLQQSRDPTRRRGAGAAGKVLALGMAGGTAVKMGVDHAGEHQQSRRINRLCCLRQRAGHCEGGDLPVCDADVEVSAPAGGNRLAIDDCHVKHEIPL